MYTSQEMQSKQFINFSKHSKNISNIKPLLSPRQLLQNQPNYMKRQYQQIRQISHKQNKQYKQIPTQPVRGHRRVISMFTGDRQKKTKLQKLQIKQKSPIEIENIVDMDQTPTFSFIQSSKKIQKKQQPIQESKHIDQDFQIFPLSFQKKNVEQQRHHHRNIRNVKIDKFELISQIMFFKNKLDTEIMKNQQLSNTYEQFLDQNYQLKQLNLNHPNWCLYQENQELKEKLNLLEQFNYHVTEPQTPKIRKMETFGKVQYAPQYTVNHNSPIRQLYPFQ